MNDQLLILYGCFFFALGACVGSFLNVVIWRLPYRGREVMYQEKRGRMTLSWPPSHCPICDAPIKWYQNIPVFSWIALKGRCANCRTPIPIRYPLVELSVAVTFVAFYLSYFVAHWPDPHAAGGHFFFVDIQRDWPVFVVHLVFIAALLAASAIDADLYIIPLSIPYMLIILGVCAAIAIPDHKALWKISDGGWWMAKPVIGGFVGLLLANLLLVMKIMPRSFASDGTDPKELEMVAAKQAEEEPMAPPPKLTRFWPTVIAASILLIVSLVSWFALSLQVAAIITVASGLIIFLLGVLPRDEGQVDVTYEVMEEISSPHVRREISKEIPFLALPVVCAVIAYFIPVDVPDVPWVARLLGSLLGMMVGGGIVWLIRIGGSLAFNKEAMGMGDAHLMAGVGAILGAPLVVIAFLTAPFLGLVWAAVRMIMGKPNVLPFGPWLSLASILCLILGNPLLGWYAGMLFGGGPVFPPVGAPPGPVMHP